VGLYLAHEPEIYPKAHENPRAFSCIFGPIFLESSIQCHWEVGLHQVASSLSHDPNRWEDSKIACPAASESVTRARRPRDFLKQGVGRLSHKGRTRRRMKEPWSWDRSFTSIWRRIWTKIRIQEGKPKWAVTWWVRRGAANWGREGESAVCRDLRFQEAIPFFFSLFVCGNQEKLLGSNSFI